MDFNSDGLLSRDEIIRGASIWGESSEQAEKRWEDMKHASGLAASHITKSNFIIYWLGKSKRHIDAEGRFDDGYASYIRLHIELLSMAKAEFVIGLMFDQIVGEKANPVLGQMEAVRAAMCFGESEEAAHQTWLKMLSAMDANQDGVISREEYITYWMGQCADKLMVDGAHFEEGYLGYLRGVMAKMSAMSQPSSKIDNHVITTHL